MKYIGLVVDIMEDVLPENVQRRHRNQETINTHPESVAKAASAIDTTNTGKIDLRRTMRASAEARSRESQRTQMLEFGFLIANWATAGRPAIGSGTRAYGSGPVGQRVV